MFERLLALYNQTAPKAQEAAWDDARDLYSNEFRQAIKTKLQGMNREGYPFSAFEYPVIDGLIEAIQRFVKQEAQPGQGPTYSSLYGRNNSDQQYKDLIDLAKVIALYRNERNYHKILLGKQTANESNITFEILYLKPHAELCAIPYQDQFDLIPIEDFKCEIKNYYHPKQAIDLKIFEHPDSSMYARYQRLISTDCGTITKPIYYALKAFVEVASNAYDANNELDSCFDRPRVAKKEKAFEKMADFISTLSPDELNTLREVRISPEENFGERIDKVVFNKECAAVFSDDLTRLLYQCDPTIKFTNTRACDIVDGEKNDLRLRGRVLDTGDTDREYLANLSKVILHTAFKVKIGNKVTSPDGISNRVPSHVAELYNICQQGLKDEMDPSEVRYKVVILAAKCYRNPHNSFWSFFNTRDQTTQNFYNMVIQEGFSSIIADNESLHEHPSFLGG